jgi:hypothetical protein
VKNKLKLAVALPAVLALASPVSGEASGPAAASATPASADQQEINIVAQKLCRAEPIIGTRIAVKRKCDTPAQLKYFQQQAREIIEQYRHRPCAMGAESGEGQAMAC